MTKQDVLLGISVALNSSKILPGNKVVLLTTAGLISADFVFTNDEEPEKTAILRNLMRGISEALSGTTKNANPEPPHLIGDKDSIMLKNVIIIGSGNSKITIPSMILYYKDIIGISIGNLG